MERFLGRSVASERRNRDGQAQDQPRHFQQEMNPDWHQAYCPHSSAVSGSTTPIG
jgi:hypothetical protein